MLVSEDDFHKLLDADPDDWQTRLVFADWLQERGDPRAEGYRALGLLRVRPMQFETGRRTEWIWTRATNHVRLSRVHGYVGPDGGTRAGKKFGLPLAWLRQEGAGWWTRGALSRREAEDGAARAFFTLLPGAREKITRGRRR